MYNESFCCIVVQLLSHVRLFATPWTAAHQASFTISWSLLKFLSIESVTPSNHLILCYPLLLLPSVFPSIRVFSNNSNMKEDVNTELCWMTVKENLLFAAEGE